MTEKHYCIPAEMIQAEKEKALFFAEIHHISEMLEELISLLKDSTESNGKNTTRELSPDNSEVMTVKEAAALMRISLPKMYEFARSGRVHSISVGRRVLISRSSLTALIREGENQNGR